ncbi:MAG: YkgJ family cysteine cluster protein [Desulfobacterales bacterium]|nr:YkgJ family cysteine cluster protein [Desulfobacterales bacterium]
MKTVRNEDVAGLKGRRINKGESFQFRCYPGIGCFNRCCRNLNLFLYPYDIVRLKLALGLTAEAFLDRYTDIVLREGSHFPEVLLRMAENDDRTCSFLDEEGCSVYRDRPDTCRTYPVEHGLMFGPDGGEPETVSFFRPPDFCLGKHEDKAWTLERWADDQEARVYNRMSRRWAAIKALFHQDPWQGQGPYGAKAKMAFMATYNIDAFRSFIFESSFLKRYRVKKERVRKMRKDDLALLGFGFEWVKLAVWNIPSKWIRPR